MSATDPRRVIGFATNEGGEIEYHAALREDEQAALTGQPWRAECGRTVTAQGRRNPVFVYPCGTCLSAARRESGYRPPAETDRW